MPWLSGYLPPHSCFHPEGEKSTAPRLSVESRPQVTGTASPLLNVATLPEHRVTHDQPTSLTEGAVGTDGKWIIYQLHISIHNITPYSHGQLTKAKLNFIDLHSTCLQVHEHKSAISDITVMTSI